jgi:molybdopterin/thiamine biosynthesis adenylyltransferase
MSFFSKEFTPDERDLYDRQFRLQGWDQKILKESKILIAGVGGLGCETAKNLAMLGVGTLFLVDLDIIEHSNLNRQILFSDAKMGEPKASVAARKLKEINPHVKTYPFYTSLERLDPRVYAASDIIIGGLDSMNARYNLNAQCVRFRKPLLDGGVSGYHGHIYTIFPHNNACFECYPLPAIESDEMAACTVVGKPRKRVHCVFKGYLYFEEKYDNPPDPKNEQHVIFIMEYANRLAEENNFLPLFNKDEVVHLINRHDPGVITINSIIASIQSHESVKILHWLKGNKSLGEPIKEYLVFNAMTMKIYPIEKKINPECPQCGENVRRVNIKIKKGSQAQKIIDILTNNGYELNPEMEPMLTIMDFNMIKEIDLDKSIAENELRHLELLTAVGFKGGSIFITLKFK